MGRLVFFISIVVLIHGNWKTQAEPVEFENDVMVLTPGNFDAAKSYVRFLMVQFCFQRSEPCRNNTRVYEEVAHHFARKWGKKEFSEVAIAKFEVTGKENELFAKQLDASASHGYPLYKIYKNGEFYQNFHSVSDWKLFAAHMRMLTKMHDEL
mmetsp:Transcript_28667/g.39598  ORF Transcript_28667/g.39598 Transcript_28667/m.39598 type:complete len:153 (+) Transcript_28667:102-560(+)|eukprot:CAMPEP_0196586310 /NCGR_PEP_ID=MMETSP1081-20130531/53825_1 /TAXON_ID=36882 /ORGANISM="Pyramimonas amylifera, Strain CCMP720" /LENGTH=152 /DNA_ID=CAMNT_0041908147 /DNA_START=98 /DNA_END=556 /DNA_ORIENTATION=-